jgi:hypothetical protein
MIATGSCPGHGTSLHSLFSLWLRFARRPLKKPLKNEMRGGLKKGLKRPCKSGGDCQSDAQVKDA